MHDVLWSLERYPCFLHFISFHFPVSYLLVFITWCGVSTEQHTAEQLLLVFLLQCCFFLTIDLNMNSVK
ncbi:hypothetical protein ARMSODRAFT_797908 [Armillaria solidipes]|uniref:Uncharacterized protein n=1 Tax=Armillaria solidipes TaxID=1076256 RepID=A0A2H3AKK8_9AGAR|nr:hypothetical protein ARMSODRAFT_797908 [Armillaria solidipes]